MKKYIGLYFLIAIPFVLNGCRSALTSTERAEPLGTPTLVQDKRVQPDRSLRKKISIVQVNESIVNGDMTRIQVILINQKTYSLDVNYAFEWFDQNGMVVNSKTPWKTLPFAGSEKKAISAVAPSSQAIDFVLKIQEPRPFSKRVRLNPFKQ